jgi:hypothetical protein
MNKKIEMKFKRLENTFGQYLFWCEGCQEYHSVWTDKRDGVEPWGFNGDVDKPTISPSILVRGGEHNRTCHSFINNGMIQYLNDCTHSLAGKTVELKNID